MIIKRNLKNYKRILDGYQEDTNFTNMILIILVKK